MSRKRTSPGEIIRFEYLEPLGMSAHALAMALRVPATRIHAILQTDNPRAITVDTALRLARYFKTTPEFWLNLQRNYDLSLIDQDEHLRLEREIEPLEIAQT